MKMNRLSIVLMFAALAVSCQAGGKKSEEQRPDYFYSLTANSLQGAPITMSDYKGKTILIVNTASECGYTPQFEGLQALYEKYKERGLVILGFPCNQFLGQEPGDEASIAQGCVLNYGVTFPMFSKIEVNGKNAHPIYKYLTAVNGGKIKWNFTKFLISPEGKVVDRFATAVTPAEIDTVLEKLLH